MRKILIMVLALFLGVVNYAHAGTEKGMSEVQAQGGLSFQSIENGTTVDQNTMLGQVTYNYFLIDNFSIGLNGRFNITQSESESTSGATTTKSETIYSTIFTMARGDIYLGGEDSVPYIGFHVGMAYYQTEHDPGGGGTKSDEDGSELSYGGQAGMKIFPNENISWNIEIDYTKYDYETEAMVDLSVSNISLLLGFSYYF